jgi:tetratricopeptide (TPR) repeat protein
MKTLAKKPWITKITEYPDKKLCWFLFVIAILLYLPTITFDYTLDDALVMTGNKYTQQGIKGTKDIFTHDLFEGFFGEGKQIVAGGRYRPFTQFIFAIQKELFGFKPWIGHLTNILSYALLMVILFLTIKALLAFPPFNNENAKLIAFISTLLYLFHPIHTEVVCNIKSLDEIFSMLGALSAILLLLSYHNKPKTYKLFLSGFIFFIALLSKENALTWIGVWVFWLIFTHKSFSKKFIVNSLIVLLIPAALFLFIRSQVLGAFLYTEIPEELLNNPFIHSTKAEELATVFYTWLLYFKLLIFPHPLTHDYYPNQIPILNFNSPMVWLAILLIVTVIVLMIVSWKRNPIISFAILMFAVNFSMVSNLFFNVGTFMNERFVFSASAGFTLAMGWLFAKWGERSPKWAMYVLIIILGLYGVKTVTRSFAWKDNLTLFTTDAKTSRNSAKVQVSAAEVLIKEAEKTNNPVKKEKLLLEALQYLKRGGEIYPEYYGVYDLGGKAQFYLKNYDLSLENYLICAKLNPKIPTPYNNIYAVGVNAFNDSVYDVAHRAFSFLTNKYPDSTKYLFQLALVYKSTYKIDSAIIILNKIIKKDSCNADAYNQLGEIYARFLGNNRKAEEYLLKAVQCDPTHSSALENLGVFYGMQGRSKDALNYFKKAHKYNPNSKNLIQNIGLAYKNLGMMDSAQYYLQKAM